MLFTGMDLILFQDLKKENVLASFPGLCLYAKSTILHCFMGIHPPTKQRPDQALMTRDTSLSQWSGTGVEVGCKA